jgi:hypothetical protein
MESDMMSHHGAQTYQHQAIKIQPKIFSGPIQNIGLVRLILPSDITTVPVSGKRPVHHYYAHTEFSLQALSN